MIRERYEASQKGTILANTMSKGGMRTGRQSHLTHGLHREVGRGAVRGLSRK